MKRLAQIIFLVTSLLASQLSFGQGYIPEESTALVSADILNVRELPSIHAEISGQLTFGEEVLITAISDSFFTSNNRTYPFVEIRYESSELEARGYVWAGLLTQTYAFDGNTLYLLKHISGGDLEGPLAEFELIKREEGEKQILNTLKNVSIERDMLDNIQLYIKPISGLNQVVHRIQIEFETLACCSHVDTYNFLELTTGAPISLPLIKNTHCDGPEPMISYQFPGDEFGEASKIVLVESSFDETGNPYLIKQIQSFSWGERIIYK